MDDIKMIEEATTGFNEHVTFSAMNATAFASGGSIDNDFEHFEPNRDPLYVVIPVTVIYVVIFFTGVVGNISTCIVISRNKSMHTATNYYLFSLAISDLLLLITGLPPEVYSIWSKYPYVFGEVFCVLRGLTAEMSANATVLTITAFTIERYVAICHPFLSHTMSKLSRAIKLILVIWLVALLFAIPQALQFGLLTHNDIVFCTQKTVLLEHSFEISTFLFFVLPMTLITVLYVLIGLRLRSSNMMKRERSTFAQGAIPLRNTPRANGSRRNAGQSSRRVLRMLVAVVVAFFICWAPFHAQRLVAIYGTMENHQATSPTMLTIYAIMTYISGVLYYLSTTVNPVLYHIMSHKFREAFKETLSRCWGGGRRAYSELARARQPARFGLATQDSTDYSGNSVREETLTSGGLHRFDTMRSSRGRRTTNGTASGAIDPIPSVQQYTTSVNNRKSPIYEDGIESACANNKSLRSVQGTKLPRNNPSNLQSGLQNNAQGLCNSGIDPNGYSGFEDDGKARQSWYILKCVKVKSPVEKKKITVENETQTDVEVFNMVPCNISNSSLRDVDRVALEDELTSYMEEIHRREKRCDPKYVKA